LANQQKKNGNVVIAFTAQAATTLGCWHEAVEFAAARNLAIIFVVENNPWADPAAFKAQDEGEDFIQKAQSYGLPGITVDGNDVVAVYRVACESLERVRQGGGPVLVEGKTYRSHAQSKRRDANSQPWRSERDPLAHMERYLKAKRLFTPRWKKQIVLEFSRELDAAVKAAQKAQRSVRN
jgi:pyruvate dehydrogenase E1 component alpha subunit